MSFTHTSSHHPWSIRSLVSLTYSLHTITSGTHAGRYAPTTERRGEPRWIPYERPASRPSLFILHLISYVDFLLAPRVSRSMGPDPCKQRWYHDLNVANWTHRTPRKQMERAERLIDRCQSLQITSALTARSTSRVYWSPTAPTRAEWTKWMKEACGKWWGFLDLILFVDFF